MQSFFRNLFISALLTLVVFKSYGLKSLKSKYQHWNESSNRISVESLYLKAEIELSSTWSLGFVGIYDSISGATPTGKPASTSSNDWLAYLEEERTAGVLSVSNKGEVFDHTFDLGHSDEPDYLSRTFGYKLSRGFAEDTLIVSAGLSLQDDRVDSSVPGGPGLGIQDKRTPEFSIGLYRILNPKTTLAANLVWSRPKGYLSDPYKQVGLTETLFPGDPNLEREVFYLYPENRPDKRKTFAFYTHVVRYLEQTNSSMDASYRYFTDDAGLNGHTYELSWLKRMGEKFIIQPVGRLYLQDAADFYMTTLDGSSITPSVQPDGAGPYYSADYRISALKTTSFGIKLTYFYKENLNFDLSFDRYHMRGTDGITSQLVYPDANVLTLGFQWEL